MGRVASPFVALPSRVPGAVFLESVSFLALDEYVSPFRCRCAGDIWDEYAAHGMATSSLFVLVVTRPLLESFMRLSGVVRNSALMGEAPARRVHPDVLSPPVLPFLSPRKRSSSNSIRFFLPAEWEQALARVKAGTGLCLPILAGDLGDLNPAFFPAQLHLFSNLSIQQTVSSVLGLPSVEVALQPAAAGGGILTAPDLARVVETVETYLQGLDRDRVPASSKAQQRALKELMLQQWHRVESVLVCNNVVGRGAFSVVYAGECDLGEVVVKAMLVRSSEVHKLTNFEREAAIMRSLDHPVRESFCPIYFSGPICIPLKLKYLSPPSPHHPSPRG